MREWHEKLSDGGILGFSSTVYDGAIPQEARKVYWKAILGAHKLAKERFPDTIGTRKKMLKHTAQYYFDIVQQAGFTDIEMEAGPFLSAIYELYRPIRHPVDEIAVLYGLPFDVGFAHYVSDTPLSKGKNLAAGSLSYWGMDSTYAVALAILRRIFFLEKHRLQ